MNLNFHDFDESWKCALIFFFFLCFSSTDFLLYQPAFEMVSYECMPGGSALFLGS